MDEEKTRLRVKLGAAEIEYEGAAQFLKDEIMPTVGKMLEMVEARTDLQRGGTPVPQIENTPLPRAVENTPLSRAVAGDCSHSTNTIAVFVNAATASELAIAAAAHLTFVKKKERMHRKEIHAEMKTAPAFYNANMRTNHTKTLATLTNSGRLRLVDEHIYALSNAERKKLEQTLAQIE